MWNSVAAAEAGQCASCCCVGATRGRAVAEHRAANAEGHGEVLPLPAGSGPLGQHGTGQGRGLDPFSVTLLLNNCIFSPNIPSEKGGRKIISSNFIKWFTGHFFSF